MGNKTITVPSVIRAACRATFYDQIPTLSDIANDESAKDGDRIKAIEALGRFGLGAADQAQVHVHAEAGSVVGVVMLPQLGEAPAGGGGGAELDGGGGANGVAELGDGAPAQAADGAPRAANAELDSHLPRSATPAVQAAVVVGTLAAGAAEHGQLAGPGERVEEG